ncbi:MAG: hypothetical protein EXS39_07015 [Opitutaceae bacterium]|nr:hypothetical protein [Opitutaceae bacterium]
MRRILVLRGGALGDFLVTLPALRLLRQRWPHARIELAGNATAAELGCTDGLLDAAHSQHESKWAQLYRPAPLSRVFAEWLDWFDLVLSYWPDPDRELQRHFPVRPGQVFLSADASPQTAPAAAHYCEPLRALGLATGDYSHHLRWGPSVRQSPLLAAARLIALHPGSGSPRKNWPLSRWAELCCELRIRPNTNLLIITGEAEPADALAAFGQHARQLPLPALARRLSDCTLFLGHDSGVSHLAAALGVPCLLLFGPTEPALWAPPGPHVRVIRRGPSLNAISVADVIAQIAR